MSIAQVTPGNRSATVFRKQQRHGMATGLVVWWNVSADSTATTDASSQKSGSAGSRSVMVPGASVGVRNCEPVQRFHAREPLAFGE